MSASAYNFAQRKLTPSRWREVTQRDAFWDDFRAKVNPGTVRKRFTVSVKTGPQKGVQPSSAHQQRRVQTKRVVPPAISTTSAKTALHGVSDEVPAAPACDDCSSLLSAEHECEICQSIEEATPVPMADDSGPFEETTQHTSENMVSEAPLEEPQYRLDSPKPPDDPAETTHFPSETPAVAPEASATRPVAKPRSLRLKVTSTATRDQIGINDELDSQASQPEHEADMKGSVEPPTRGIQLKFGANPNHEQARVEDEPKSADAKRQDNTDAKVNPELPVDVETKVKPGPPVGFKAMLNLSTTASREQSRINDELDSKQIKHEEDADTKVKSEPHNNTETKPRSIKIEDNEEPPKPVANSYVRVKHDGAEHIVPSDELKPCTHNGEDFFIVNLKGTPAIVPAADVETLPESDLVEVKVKVEREWEGSSMGIKRERRRRIATIEIEDD